MRRTVVIVSKDSRVHSLLKSMRGPALRVIEAPSGLAALFVCASQPVDALVIDVDTPGMEWPRLVEKLSSAVPALPVITLPAAEAQDTLRAKLDAVFAAAARRKQPAAAFAALPAVRARRGA
jgi:CheY-like chemotaxis protein